jgi:hypothetical protein
VGEEAGCEGLLEGGDSGEGCGVGEVEVGESHCCGGDWSLLSGCLCKVVNGVVNGVV